MSLRVADITDLGVAKRVATLALAENERLYARLEALTKQLAALSGAKAPEQLELELLRIREQMLALQRRAFAASSEKRPRDGEAGDGKGKPEPPTGPREQRKPPLEEHMHELAPRERCCAGCGREMVEWSGQQWDGLLVFLDDPHVPLSNNAAERAIRGPVVGRNNFAGCKSVRGTEVAAILYTLLESAKLAGVEPRAYLRAAAEAALTGGPPLLPHVYRERLRAERAAMHSASVSPPAPDP